MRYATKLAWAGIGFVALLLLLAAAAFAAAFGLVGGSSTVHPTSNFSVEQARESHDFPVYYAGDEVNGYPLTAVNRSPLGPTRKNASSVVFTYGTCDVGGGFDAGGCAMPVEISNEPACSRNLGMYGGGLGPDAHPRRLRGATAAFFEGGSRIEIQTGTTTVVIFAFSRREALEVARSLRGVNTPVEMGEALPPPAPGALEGNVPCPRPSR
jgi:hypothetical protein